MNQITNTYKVTTHFESDADQTAFLKLIQRWEEGRLRLESYPTGTVGDPLDEPEESFSVTTECVTFHQPNSLPI